MSAVAIFLTPLDICIRLANMSPHHDARLQLRECDVLAGGRAFQFFAIYAPRICIAHPHSLKHILADNFSNYVKVVLNL